MPDVYDSKSINISSEQFTRYNSLLEEEIKQREKYISDTKLALKERYPGYETSFLPNINVEHGREDIKRAQEHIDLLQDMRTVLTALANGTQQDIRKILGLKSSASAQDIQQTIQARLAAQTSYSKDKTDLQPIATFLKKFFEPELQKVQRELETQKTKKQDFDQQLISYSSILKNEIATQQKKLSEDQSYFRETYPSHGYASIPNPNARYVMADIENRQNDIQLLQQMKAVVDALARGAQADIKQIFNLKSSSSAQDIQQTIQARLAAQTSYSKDKTDLQPIATFLKEKFFEPELEKNQQELKKYLKAIEDAKIQAAEKKAQQHDQLKKDFERIVQYMETTILSRESPKGKMTEANIAKFKAINALKEQVKEMRKQLNDDVDKKFTAADIAEKLIMELKTIQEPAHRRHQEQGIRMADSLRKGLHTLFYKDDKSYDPTKSGVEKETQALIIALDSVVKGTSPLASAIPKGPVKTKSDEVKPPPAPSTPGRG